MPADTYSEPFEIFDQGNCSAGVARPRGEVHRQGLFHRAVSTAALHCEAASPSNCGVSVLLQQRAASKDTNPLRWDTSCGEHLTPGESYAAAALRGLKEEVNLCNIETSNILAMIPLYRSFSSPPCGSGERRIDREFMAFYTVFVSDSSSEAPVVEPDPTEVATTDWLPLESLTDRLADADKWCPGGRAVLLALWSSLVAHCRHLDALRSGRITRHCGSPSCISEDQSFTSVSSSNLRASVEALHRISGTTIPLYFPTAGYCGLCLQRFCNNESAEAASVVRHFGYCGVFYPSPSREITSPFSSSLFHKDTSGPFCGVIVGVDCKTNALTQVDAASVRCRGFVYMTCSIPIASQSDDETTVASDLKSALNAALGFVDSHCLSAEHQGTQVGTYLVPLSILDPSDDYAAASGTIPPYASTVLSSVADELNCVIVATVTSNIPDKASSFTVQSPHAQSCDWLYTSGETAPNIAAYAVATSFLALDAPSSVPHCDPQLL